MYKQLAAADETEEEICKKAVSRYGQREGIANAVLVLWKQTDPEKKMSLRAYTVLQANGTPAKKPKTSQVAKFEIPIVKEFLMMASPVFRTMFTGSFKEASTCRVELPGKSINAVLDMLDHLYPSRKLTIDDQKAAALLPLAHEYQIKELKDLCVSELQKFVRPRLEYVTLAEIFELNTFLTEAIDMCAKKLSLADIDKQKTEPTNKSFNDSVLLRILRRKTVMAGNFVTNALMKSVDVISDGHTPTITSCTPYHAFGELPRGSIEQDNIIYIINREYNTGSHCSKADSANEKDRIKKNLKELRKKFDSNCPKF